MKNIHLLNQYSALLEIRLKAARRNSIFIGVLFLAFAAFVSWWLRSEYNIDWMILVFIFLFINMGNIINLYLSSEVFHKGMIDFIKILEQIEE